ncbi:protein tyrosine phosphatase family protein [Niveibacterium terrae]|uniref:protein tyrosine phosphatase family protein n=1 Tax=Niveibacterium terrae TaxID=3373598 RepID=UPI003A91CD27
MDAENTYQVFDGLWSSGQLTERDIDSLPSLGVEVVINLAPPTAASALPGEAEKVTRRGLSYFQIPVIWDEPKPDQFEQFAALLDAFAQRKIWVHCGKNMRAGVFLYLYRRFVLGEDEQVASFPLREVWQPNVVWQAFIDRVSAAHSGV